jgi:glycosyltransferase involved in cell wall biosynthesis
MADALADCLGQPEKYRGLAAAGRQQVLECYDWDSLAAKLEAVWEQCVRSGRREVACASPS